MPGYVYKMYYIYSMYIICALLRKKHVKRLPGFGFAPYQAALNYLFNI